jgi:predicted nucleic acid-binding protein
MGWRTGRGSCRWMVMSFVSARLMAGSPLQLAQDAMIAATARVHHLTVVTRNVRDFKSFDVPVLDPFAQAK